MSNNTGTGISIPKARMPKALELQYLGQFHTLADISEVLCANKEYRNAGDLIYDLSRAIQPYKIKSIIADEAFDAFSGVLTTCMQNNISTNGKAILSLLQSEDFLASTKDAIAYIMKCRAIFKLSQCLKELIEIYPYQEPKDLIEDLKPVINGWKVEAHEPCSTRTFTYNINLNEDPVEYKKFCKCLKRRWNDILDDNNVVDWRKIDRIFLKAHWEKIQSIGLEKVLEKDYHKPSSDGRYIPIRTGTGPEYKTDSSGRPVPACGESAHPKLKISCSSYLIESALLRACEGENHTYIVYYDSVNGYTEYLPKDINKPIYYKEEWEYYDGLWGDTPLEIREFDTKTEKSIYILQRLKEIKLLEQIKGNNK